MQTALTGRTVLFAIDGLMLTLTVLTLLLTALMTLLLTVFI